MPDSAVNFAPSTQTPDGLFPGKIIILLSHLNNSIFKESQRFILYQFFKICKEK
jgi:hypothetical protein